MKFLYLIVFLGFVIFSCTDQKPTTNEPVEVFSKITFIELGSVNCIPCQKMQPIMKTLGERYGEEQLNVKFIDVIKDREAAEPYKIRVMPTQVFLDKNGDEFHRHEGFYPEEEIDSLLQAHGLSPVK